jgi:hypothetical protein
MEQWDLQESLVAWGNLDHQGSLVLQGLRETWDHQETRVA